MYILEPMAPSWRINLEKTTLDAVLFDLDGTLMDTDDLMVEGLSLRLQSLGWPWLSRQARRLVMLSETPINAAMTVLDYVGLDGPLLGLWRWLRGRRDDEEPGGFPLMEGAGEMLNALGRRFRMAVVTTRGRDDAEAFLREHGLEDVFDLVVTREDTWRLKPHPAPIRLAARKLGLSPAQCAMVGDTTVDVRSARRAGAKAIAVACGFGRRRELRRAGADVVLDCVSDLPEVL